METQLEDRVIGRGRGDSRSKHRVALALFGCVGAIAVVGQVAVRFAWVLCTSTPSSWALWEARLAMIGLGLGWALAALGSGRIVTGRWAGRSSPWTWIAVVLAVTFAVVGLTFAPACDFDF